MSVHAVAPTRTDASLPILVVEDDAGIQNLMRRWLEAERYTVIAAATAEEAMVAIESSPPAVVLCDIRLPGHDGLWFVDHVRHSFPETAVIMATALRDVAPAVESLRHGVVDYLTKPFARDRLHDAVARAAEWHRAAADARWWRERLEADMESRFATLAANISAASIDSDASLDRFLRAVTSPESYAHGYRVAAMSVSVARALGHGEADVCVIEHGALLHDIGKLAVPDALLRKPAPLTPHERALIRRHPALGAGLIGRIPFLTRAATVVRDAHERLDGLGYPCGSRGDDVWIGARIVGVADAYDTMTRPRVFRDAITASAALHELTRCSGTQFDPCVVEEFIRIVDAQ